MKAYERGSASVDLVISSAMVIVFVVMPVLAMLIEKIVVLHTINRVVDVMEGTLYAVTEPVSLEALSVGEIRYDMIAIGDGFEEAFEANVANLTEVSLINLEFYPAASTMTLNGTQTLVTYDTLHVDLEIAYRHVFYEAVFHDESYKKIAFRYDLELPKNR